MSAAELLDAARVLGEKIAAHRAVGHWELAGDYAGQRSGVLRELNAIPGWTQRRIADGLGVSQAAVWKAINREKRGVGR